MEEATAVSRQQRRAAERRAAKGQLEPNRKRCQWLGAHPHSHKQQAQAEARAERRREMRNLLGEDVVRAHSAFSAASRRSGAA